MSTIDRIWIKMVKITMTLILFHFMFSLISALVSPLSRMVGIPQELSGLIALVLLARFAQRFRLRDLFYILELEAIESWNKSTLKKWTDGQVSLEHYNP